MFGRRRKNTKHARYHSSRALRFESLEGRRMLQGYTVINPFDRGPLLDAAVEGTLSWAITQVNANSGGGLHEIVLSVDKITVRGNLPPITHALTNVKVQDGRANVHIERDLAFANVFNGLRYDGSIEGAGKLTIRDLEISNFVSNAILIQSLSDGDQVEIANTVLHENGASGILSFDIATGTDARINIHNNWIYGNGGDAISIAGPGGAVPSPSAMRNTINNNVIGRTPPEQGNVARANSGHGITLGQGTARFDITNNAIENVTTSTKDAIVLLSTALTQNKISATRIATSIPKVS